MKEQLLLLLRVSKPEYNRTLYEDYKLYMNNQFSYKNRVNKGTIRYKRRDGCRPRRTIIIFCR